MPSNYPSFLLTKAFAEDGTKTLPPVTAVQAGVGRFCQAEGFPVATERPLTQGGVPPTRSDMNGLLWVLSRFALWFQQGGVMNWTATLAYEVGNEVLYNGVKYRCIQACTNVVPTTRTYWRNLDDTVPNGAIMCFGNLAGISDNHPIFNGSSAADETWYLCDGTNGTPDLRDRFIMGGDSATLSTGGTNSLAISVANLPSHNHGTNIDTGSAGAHTHSRGTMEITGDICVARTGNGNTPSNPSHGALSYGDRWNAQVRNGADDDWGSRIVFRASNGWSGETSQAPNHSHKFGTQNTGGGTPIDNRPAFVKVAYFMKVNG